MSKALKIEDMDFVRAGTDFLGYGWSAHIAGVEFEAKESYEFERSDGTTFKVWAVHKEEMSGKMTWFVVDEDAAMLMGL